jgi:hypothetical protein
MELLNDLLSTHTPKGPKSTTLETLTVSPIDTMWDLTPRLWAVPNANKGDPRFKPVD